MTADNVEASLPQLTSAILRPYGSVVVLECIDNDRSDAFTRLTKFLRKTMTNPRRGSVTIVASGFGPSAAYSAATQDGAIDQIDGLICRREDRPSWLSEDSIYTDIGHTLLVAARRRQLIAVHCEESVQRALLRWLKRDAIAPLRLVPPEILQGALLQGEAKGLWLRGTHARRTTKPDSKNISGQRLQDALSPLDDGTFAMGSARASLPGQAAGSALFGVVGTTPRRALVWKKSTASFGEFIAFVVELLDLLDATYATDGGVERPFLALAAEVHDLGLVNGAYEISCLSPEDLPSSPDVSEDLLTAAETLQQAVLNVSGTENSPDFFLDVGLHGAIGGQLNARVTQGHNGVDLSFGFRGEPTDLLIVRPVLDALDAYGTVLATVHYRSGHAVSGHGVYSDEVYPAPFPGWQFSDFDGYDLLMEKPDAHGSAAIHAAIGEPGDTSLFAWVVRHFAGGWLTCDDGAGEVADFVHLNPTGELSLIHVKRADSRGSTRRIAATPYEQVCSQAKKNLVHLRRDRLQEHLLKSGPNSPACWTDGRRVEDRTELIDLLSCRKSGDGIRVVIVQPHVSENAYRRVRALVDVGNETDEGYRLQMLETLLNSTRSAVTAFGGDLTVVGSTV